MPDGTWPRTTYVCAACGGGAHGECLPTCPGWAGGVPVLVVPAEVTDRYKAALELLADRENWCGDPAKHESYLYGHATPFEVAVDALQRKPCPRPCAGDSAP